ncbi:MAG: hypothetical protein ACI87E_001970 [Mariniblastus sp.]|jgi:hypothetical protein
MFLATSGVHQTKGGARPWKIGAARWRTEIGAAACNIEIIESKTNSISGVASAFSSAFSRQTEHSV